MTTDMVKCTGEPSVSPPLPAYPAYVSPFHRPIDQNGVDALAVRRCARAYESTSPNKLESSRASNSWLQLLQ